MENFETIKWPDGTQWLALSPKQLDEQIAFARKNKVHYFIHNWHSNDNGQDLSALNQLVVKGLNINFSGIKSNEQINEWKELKILLSMQGGPVTNLNFSNLSNLEWLEMTWNPKMQELSMLENLRRLNLQKYKPGTKNLEAFKPYKQIRQMVLLQPTMMTLDGVQELALLSELKIARPKGFKSFVSPSLSQNCLPGLTELDLSFCKELDYESIPPLRKLLILRITDGGEGIESLAPIIEKMPALKEIVCTRTELKDGHLDYLLKHLALEKVTIDHKKHYNKKEQEINNLLAEKKKRN